MGVMIHVARVSEGASTELPAFNRNLFVDSELRLRFDDGKLNYEVIPVEPYKKTYPPLERTDSSGPMVTLVAYSTQQPVGRIDISKNWNGFAYIHDLVVAKESRRSGVASELLVKAREWAKTERLAGVMAETQTNNVPACRLYERCGFHLSGFDTDLYWATQAAGAEIALFWYWHSSAHRA